MTRLSSLFLLFTLLVSSLLASSLPASAQFPGQQEYVVGAGSANAQTASFPNATALADLLGVNLRIKAGATNTAAATLTVNSFSAQSIVKTSPTGPVALVGNEIISTQIFEVVWDGTNFQLISAVNNAAIPQGCQFGNLTIVNNAGTPNTSIDVAYTSSILLVPATGAGIGSGSKSFTVNTTTGTGGTSTANGMDGTARGNNNMISLWAISNGTTWAGLASSLTTYPTAPTLPSGYTYACYIGSMKTNGSGNFYGTSQQGSDAHYVNGGNLNTTLPQMATGVGTSTNCGTATPTWQSFSVRGTTGATIWVPSTAVAIDTILANNVGGTPATVFVAPSSSYGGAIGTAVNPPPMTLSSTFAGSMIGRLWFESNNLSYCSAAAGGAFFAYGWKDKGVLAY